MDEQKSFSFMPNTIIQFSFLSLFRFSTPAWVHFPYFPFQSSHKAAKKKKSKHPDRETKKPNSMRNFLYHHPVSTTSPTHPKREYNEGSHQHRRTPERMKSEPRKSGKESMWMRQNIFPRHFYPVLRMKFFNPEKKIQTIRSSCAKCYAILKGGRSNNSDLREMKWKLLFRVSDGGRGATHLSCNMQNNHRQTNAEMKGDKILWKSIKILIVS